MDILRKTYWSFETELFILRLSLAHQGAANAPRRSGFVWRRCRCSASRRFVETKEWTWTSTPRK